MTADTQGAADTTATNDRSTAQSLGPVPGGPAVIRRPLALWYRRRSIRLLVGRDLKVRYASSVLGYVWSVLEPLLMAGVYWFVFTQIFRRSVGEDPYMVFLLAGLLPWTWFNAGVIDTAKALRSEAKLVRSTNVPREIWVLRVVISKGIEFLLSLPVLFFFVAVYRSPVNWEIVFLVPAAVLLATLLLGLGLLLAPLVVLVRDLERVVRIALRFGFYASPVVFAVPDVPRPWSTLFALNPMSGIFELCRAGFFPGHVDWIHVGLATVISVVVLVIGWAVFARLERTVLKEI